MSNTIAQKLVDIYSVKKRRTLNEATFYNAPDYLYFATREQAIAFDNSQGGSGCWVLHGYAIKRNNELLYLSTDRAYKASWPTTETLKIMMKQYPNHLLAVKPVQVNLYYDSNIKTEAYALATVEDTHFKYFVNGESEKFLVNLATAPRFRLTNAEDSLIFPNVETVALKEENNAVLHRNGRRGDH